MSDAYAKLTKGFRFANLTVKPAVLLAPVDGVFDPPCRKIYLQFNPGASFSEMVDANMVVHNFKKALQKLTPAEGEHPYGVQLMGKSPELLAEAARIVYNELEGIDFFDFNLGCPSRLVVRSGGGVALMRNPSLAAKCVEALAQAQPLPVSVKMRAGFDEQTKNAPEVARVCVEAGAQMVTVHGRVRAQFYSGAVDFDLIAKVVETVSVPVVGNGGIDSPDAALRMIERTGCSGVMVATAAFGNPWLIQDIVRGRRIKPAVAERFRVMREHLEESVRFFGEPRGVVRMRKHLAWYIKGLPHATEIRRRLMRLTTKAEVLDLLTRYESLLLGKSKETGNGTSA